MLELGKIVLSRHLPCKAHWISCLTRLSNPEWTIYSWLRSTWHNFSLDWSEWAEDILLKIRIAYSWFWNNNLKICHCWSSQAVPFNITMIQMRLLCGNG
jgi:hypothetical protein